MYDIFCWEESKTVLQQVFVMENIDITLQQELSAMENKNILYSDEELSSLIDDMISGLDYLRINNLSVPITIESLYKVGNHYKWNSYYSDYQLLSVS